MERSVSAANVSINVLGHFYKQILPILFTNRRGFSLRLKRNGSEAGLENKSSSTCLPGYLTRIKSIPKSGRYHDRTRQSRGESEEWRRGGGERMYPASETKSKIFVNSLFTIQQKGPKRRVITGSCV